MQCTLILVFLNTLFTINCRQVVVNCTNSLPRKGIIHNLKSQLSSRRLRVRNTKETVDGVRHCICISGNKTKFITSAEERGNVFG